MFEDGSRDLHKAEGDEREKVSTPSARPVKAEALEVRNKERN